MRENDRPIDRFNDSNDRAAANYGERTRVRRRKKEGYRERGEDREKSERERERDIARARTREVRLHCYVEFAGPVTQGRGGNRPEFSKHVTVRRAW